MTRTKTEKGTGKTYRARMMESLLEAMEGNNSEATQTALAEAYCRMYREEQAEKENA